MKSLIVWMVSLLALSFGSVGVAKERFEVEVLHEGSDKVEQKGSIIFVGESVGTDNLIWKTVDSDHASSQLSGFLYGNFSVVLGHLIWDVKANQLSSEWTEWKPANSYTEGYYSFGTNSRQWSYELLRAQGQKVKVSNVIPENVDNNYLVRYRKINK